MRKIALVAPVLALLALAAPASAQAGYLHVARAQLHAVQAAERLDLAAPVVLGRCARRSAREVRCNVAKVLLGTGTSPVTGAPARTNDERHAVARVRLVRGRVRTALRDLTVCSGWTDVGRDARSGASACWMPGRS